MPTGLLVAFIVLGLVLVAGVVLWVIVGNKNRAIKKQRKMEALNEQKEEDKTQGGF